MDLPLEFVSGHAAIVITAALGFAAGIAAGVYFAATKEKTTKNESSSSDTGICSDTVSLSRSDWESYMTLRSRYELVTTNIAASVVIHDVSGSIQLCTPYTQVLTGYSPDEITACSGEGEDFFSALVIEEDRERYLRAFRISRLGEEIIVRYKIVHRSGLRLWLETRMVPILDEQAEINSVMSVTIDVTDSMSYQEQIEEQNRDLSDFAYMVSHDLKAPIFTIKGMASALIEDYGDTLGEDGQELIRHIVEGTIRLEELVNSVIEYSAAATMEGSKSLVALEKVLLHVQADLAEQIKQKKARLEVCSPLPSVFADDIRLYQVFSNVINNALKYSHPDRAPVITVSASKPTSSSVTVEVRDNGLGIPPGRIEDIFRPYHRAHGKEIEGSGIGLACVKKIMDRIGGSVTVQSEQGTGSIFSLIFPVPPSDPREVPADLARLF